MGKNLTLTGMMGVGKSTIGKNLAKKLNYKFVDVDKLIEAEEGSSINLIFKNKSEQYFRKIESEITLIELKKENAVISLGGGAFLNNAIRKSAKKVILSTGMSSLDEVKNAYKILNKSPLSAKKIFVLHCNTNYPTENRSVNMSALKVLKKTFGNNIGYSDHTKGNDASLLSIALGAKIIEKHITLDKNLKGPDHKASLNPEQFKNFVKKLRDAEKMLGIGIKKIDSSEKGNIKIIRKSVIAYKKIKKGEKFSNDNLTCKRPGNGISPMKFYKLLGKKSKKNYRYDSLISSIELKK